MRDDTIRISPDRFPDALKAILKEYTAEVERAVEKAIREYVDQDLIPELRRRSPRRAGDDPHYADGWASKKDGMTRIVYNSIKPWLTHLLEYGHVDHDTGMLVAKRPHMRAAYEATIDKLQARIIAGLKS